jgi:cell division protein FtsQ
MEANKRHRKRKKREKRRKILLNFILLLFVFILLYLFAFKTDFFTIKNIEIVGNKKLSNDAILNVSMCVKGENIFKINKNYCQDSINSLAYIKGVEIERRLPSTIKIKVKEREEVAAIPYIGALVYIDEEGCILNIEEKSGEINLPQIFGLDLVNLKIGDFLFKGEEEKLDFLRIGKSNNTLKQMKYINFSSEENTMLELKNNIKVAFGPLDNVKYKLSFLNEILKDIDKKELKVKQILMNKGDNPILVVED